MKALLATGLAQARGSKAPLANPPVVPARAWERSVVGGFYLIMGGVHLGLVAARPQVYRNFADHALFGSVVDGWRDVFMAAPVIWGLCLMAGEVALGTALLLGGTAARVGWVGVITFHLLLMVFGFGFWLWSVPALGLLIWLARRDGRKSFSSGFPGATP
jgi:hypothetical protein